MAKKINRIGETGRNNFGSEMIITKYRMNGDIDVYFPEYDWTSRGIQYVNFKNGEIKCPYERRYFGIGYLGEGKYKRNYTYIDVYFPEYNWTFKDATYSNFKKGNIKCPYERRVYGVGYLGEGKYKASENGKKTRAYKT